MRKNIKTQILIDEGSYPFLYGFQKQKFCLEILSIPFHKKSAAGGVLPQTYPLKVRLGKDDWIISGKPGCESRLEEL